MNVDRGAFAKIPATAHAIDGAEIFAIQEADLSIDPPAGFQEEWKRRGYAFFPAEPDLKGVVRTGVFTSLAAAHVRRDDDIDATRCSAWLFDVPQRHGYFKFLIVGIYGFASDLVDTKILVDNVVRF